MSGSFRGLDRQQRVGLRPLVDGRVPAKSGQLSGPFPPLSGLAKASAVPILVQKLHDNMVVYALDAFQAPHLLH